MQIVLKMRGDRMTDRNKLYQDGNTIHWSDFSAFLFGSDIKDMGQLLNRQCIAKTKEGEEIFTIAPSFIARSIIKLQSLGVLQYDFITTLGNTSSNNIDRFHITFFGQKVLEYIDLDEDIDHENIKE